MAARRGDTSTWSDKLDKIVALAIALPIITGGAVKVWCDIQKVLKKNGCQR